MLAELGATFTGVAKAAIGKELANRWLEFAVSLLRLSRSSVPI